jgi:Fe-S oxidoreductase
VAGIEADAALNEALFGIDCRRTLPELSRRTLASRLRGKSATDASVLLFNDTFTNYYDPEIGVAAWEVMEAAGLKVALAPNRLLRPADDLERACCAKRRAGAPQYGRVV